MGGFFFSFSTVTRLPDSVLVLCLFSLHLFETLFFFFLPLFLLPFLPRLLPPTESPNQRAFLYPPPLTARHFFPPPGS